MPNIEMNTEELVLDTCNHLDRFEHVSKRDWRLVVRRSWPEHSDVIIKLWARPDGKGRIRRLTRTSSACYEWRNLRRFHTLGIRVPAPIAMVNLPANRSGYTEALVMEDLGACTGAVDYLKQQISSGNEDAAYRFEQEIIEITAAMLAGKVIDWDHGLVNIVATTSGEAVRLDLEQARHVLWMSMKWNRRLYVRMLGTLLSTYTFAVQPDVDRVIDFAIRLFARLTPSLRDTRLIQERLDTVMAYQHQRIGMDVRVQLPLT